MEEIIKNTYVRHHLYRTLESFAYIVTKMRKPKMIEKREKKKKGFKRLQDTHGRHHLYGTLVPFAYTVPKMLK